MYGFALALSIAAKSLQNLKEPRKRFTREMASAASMSMALAVQNRVSSLPASEVLPKLPVSMKKVRPHIVLKQSKAKASLKEMAAARMSAAMVAAWMVVPEMAQAADGLTPSLQNFLLSIAAGGVVLGAIAGAVIGVSNFDPIRRA
ncbi:uncharacterized protein LOC127250416 [Andrographis paniculata]|uniref:uncharacterized protein LOC127250416 n=1 Tax=Andrographis paniculata TaxID=175694 RepID=UPI0021E7FCEE|nr:uncharacterized protein LOC127250416 [Andrographis paniculata]